jgi:hypothetical protein
MLSTPTQSMTTRRNTTSYNDAEKFCQSWRLLLLVHFEHTGNTNAFYRNQTRSLGASMSSIADDHKCTVARSVVV